MNTTSPSAVTRSLDARRAYRAACSFAFSGALALAPLAHAYPGQKLLEWSKNNLILPLGIISVVVALAASMIKPEFVKGAVYAAVICAVLFFVVQSAPQLMEAMK